tara:strand:- start:147 stop:800 length:654 start_codon:yes stop_codon:yes gene_type:complete
MTLQELINKRKGKEYIDSTIESINNETTRIVTGKITGKKEFKYYGKNNYVKEGVPYHIHYTKSLEEYYMTESQHGESSKLIYPTKKDTDFSYYNGLNKQSPMILKGTSALPTEDDYKKSFYERFFAKKVNESKSVPFEISSNQFDSSPLYIYVSVIWRISGNKIKAKEFNDLQIEKARKVMPNIRNVLKDYQFFRFDEILDVKETVLNKLGMLTNEY